MGSTGFDFGYRTFSMSTNTLLFSFTIVIALNNAASTGTSKTTKASCGYRMDVQHGYSCHL